MTTFVSKLRLIVFQTDPMNILIVRSCLEKQWKTVFPGRPFESKLQEDIVYEEANGYNDNLSRYFSYYTLGFPFIGIRYLGVGQPERSEKNEGNRNTKGIGWSVGSIIQLLNKEFSIILTLAVVLGGSGGFLLTNALLGNLYAQHIEIGLVTIVLCSLSVFAIGISTTSTTILRAATEDPTRRSGMSNLDNE